MYYIQILLISLLLYGGGTGTEKAQNSGGGIQFRHMTYQAALEQARQQNKPVFIELYSSLCGYCKKMESDVFTEPALGETFNSGFINVRINVSSKDGRPLVEKYGAHFTPTLVFVAPDGKLITRTFGYQESESLLQTAKMVKQKVR